MTDNITQRVASYAASTSCGALPPEVNERTKQVIADEIACAFIARRSLAGDLTARYAEQQGGPAESRIYATGKRVSAVNAALANGAAGHGEEIDGAHVIGGHPGACIVHAATAMAERQRATGADLVNAVALGYDVGVRMVEAGGGLFTIKKRFGLNSDFLYAIGCASAAARLLGLDAARHGHAMALTTFAANATASFYAERRHISKSVCNGQFAAAGVSGAQMAALGLEGHDDVLGTDYGVFHCWGKEESRDALDRDLGKVFKVMGANFKFVNAGYPIHAPSEAASTLLKEHGIGLDDITAVYVGMPSNAMKVVDGRDMHNICVQDMVTAAMVLGGLQLLELPFPAMLDNPAFPKLRPLVNVQGDPDLDRDQPAGRGAIVRITTRDGQTHTKRVDHPRGHSMRGGVSWSDLEGKWREGLPGCDVDRLLSVAQRMDQLEDVNELLDAFQVKA